MRQPTRRARQTATIRREREDQFNGWLADAMIATLRNFPFPPCCRPPARRHRRHQVAARCLSVPAGQSISAGGGVVSLPPKQRILVEEKGDTHCTAASCCLLRFIPLPCSSTSSPVTPSPSRLAFPVRQTPRLLAVAAFIRGISISERKNKFFFACRLVAEVLRCGCRRFLFLALSVLLFFFVLTP